MTRAAAATSTKRSGRERGQETPLKGVILSGGKGSRLRPFTYTGAKQLVPVANKPVLFYAIEQLVESGITEIGIVVGDTADQVKAAVGDGSSFGARVTYIQQDAPLGIAHAVKVARDYIGDSPFVLFLGDNFVLGGVKSYVDRFRVNGCNSQILLCPVENPQSFGVAEFVDGRLARIVEKPAHPSSNLAVIGVYMFDQHVFEAVEQLKPSPRGELEITDTIQYLLDGGYRVEAEVLDRTWIDTGKTADILAASRAILETLPPRQEGEVDERSRVYDPVILEPGVRVVNSVLRGPLIIGEETEIVDSYVGPYTSIDRRCRVEGLPHREQRGDGAHGHRGDPLAHRAEPHRPVCGAAGRAGSGGELQPHLGRSQPHRDAGGVGVSTYLVTGGCGFIGSNFILHLLECYPRCRVINLDKLTYAGNPESLREVAQAPRYQFVQGDIGDAALVEELVPQAEVIVNFAAETHVDRSLLEAGSFIATDVYGTYVLLEAARRHRNVKRILHVSTDEVYGDMPEGESSRETDILRPRSPYAASKAGGEMQCIAYVETYGLPVMVARPANNLGPRQHIEKFVPLCITNALIDEPLPVYGDGLQVRDWLYVEDDCEALELLLREGEPGAVYNIGAGNQRYNLQVAEAVLDLLGKPRSLIRFVEDRQGHDRRYSLNWDKLHALGWSPRHDFAAALEKTVSWYVENRWWWEAVRAGRFQEYYRQQYAQRLAEARPYGSGRGAGQ